MASTPPRAVRWNLNDISPSLLHSPALNASTESYVSTSSLEYLNAQLVAHGYVPPPGISLDGLSGTHSDRVVKCLLGMLSQRVEDLSRTEDLSTKLRTLTYDHERLLTMHRTANENLANAEREVNLHKTKLTASTRALQSTENAHKLTTAELQRTRTTLQGIRATHQQELRKKEKEYERMADKWNKVSDAQTKLGSVPAGLRCTNAAINDGSEILPKTPSLLDTALDESENARAELTDEVARLRRLVVKVCNQVQAMLFQVRGFISGKDEEGPILTVTNLFPMHPPTHAHDTLSAVLRSLKDDLAVLPQHIASSPVTIQSTSASQSTTRPYTKPTEPNPEEIARLNATIASLQEEIKHSRKQTQLQATQTQELFDNFVAAQQRTSANIGEMSMELMSGPEADAERERLDKIKQELDAEREKFTLAAIKLGKERAALDAERKKLSDEKRSWEVQQMLADLPPTPNPHPAPQSNLQPPQEPRAQTRKSPRKPNPRSPSKKPPRKTHKRQSSSGSSRKATHVSRRSSTTTTKPTVVHAYETELTATTSEPQQQAPPPPLPAPSFSLKPATTILPSFVLPPPSPHASLPRQPLLPPSTQFQPTPHSDYLLAHLPPPSVESTPFPSSNSHPNPMISPPGAEQGYENRVFNPVVTPMKRPFPVAKLFAPQTIHAYSPAKPSPLSRILMLNNSLDGSDSSQDSGESTPGPLPAAMGIVHEEALFGRGGYHAQPETPVQAPQQMMSLAAELGVESPPDVVDNVEEPPLKKRKSNPSGRNNLKTSKPTTSGNKGARERPATAASRGSRTTSATQGGGGGEKENTVRGSRRVSGKTSTSATAPSTTRGAGNVSKAAPTTAKTKTSTTGGAGPRRVPINSAEAPAQIGRRRS